MYEFIQDNKGLFAGVFFMLAMIFLGAAAYFAWLFLRAEKKADQRLKQARADITDMTILFQTMRDIIGQQKTLAKEFNEELEHKMEQVKHILNQGMEKNKQLHEKQQRITMELEEAQAQIDVIYRQLAQSPKAAGSNGANAPAPNPAPARKEVPAPAPKPRPAEDFVLAPQPPTPPPTAPARPAPPESAPRVDQRDVPVVAQDQLIRSARTATPETASRPSVLSAAEEARLADTGVTRAPFKSWVADDFELQTETARKARPPKQEAPDPAEKGPTNGDAAREAFRALLNMPSPDRETAPLDIVPQMPPSPESGEGAVDELSQPLQQRVLEYSEAGMTVAQVSRELGIGKGEVRLMLSLAKQKAPRVE